MQDDDKLILEEMSRVKIEVSKILNNFTEEIKQFIQVDKRKQEITLNYNAKDKSVKALEQQLQEISCDEMKEELNQLIYNQKEKIANLLKEYHILDRGGKDKIGFSINELQFEMTTALNNSFKEWMNRNKEQMQQ